MHILIAALHRPSKPTGVCRHAANLAQCLANAQEVTRVTLVVGEWQKYYFESAFSLGSPKIQLKSIEIRNSSLHRNAWFLFELPQLAKELRPDILHLSFPIPFIRSRFRVPIVSTVHDLYPYEYPENFGFPQVLFNRLFLQQCIQNSDGLSAVSQTTLKALKRYFPGICDRKETAVIYNSVDFEDLLPRLPGFMKESSGNPFLLCVAQHRKNKNLDLLIQAFSVLLQAGKLSPASQLIIVGNPGPESEHLSKLVARLSLESQVLMVSAIDDRELYWLYQNCEVFVIPSSTEGFCIPLVEALHLSCTTVCSNIPIFTEVGSERCIYFDLQSAPVENLCRAITQAINQPRSNSQLQDQRFSKAIVAQHYLRLYCQVSQPAKSSTNDVKPANSHP